MRGKVRVGGGAGAEHDNKPLLVWCPTFEGSFVRMCSGAASAGGHDGATDVRTPMGTRGMLSRSDLDALIEAGEIDPSFVVTHPAGLEDTPEMYKKFRDKKDGVIKMVLRPGGTL